jgi:Carboxypeptidase regulatory-like domain
MALKQLQPAIEAAVALCLLLLSTEAFAQAGFGSIAGTVSTPAHAPAPDITVEAKNVQTGVYYKAKTSANGEYTFAQLPAGTYQVLVLNLFYRPFVGRDVAVSPGSGVRVDVQLAANIAFATLGEIGALWAVKRPPPPQGRTPRMPDGKPDFSGVWMTPAADVASALSTPFDLLPWAEEVVRQRILTEAPDAPSSRCLPPPTDEPAIFPVEYIQTKTRLVELVEDVVAAHQIYLDGRGHPTDLDPTWQGHSIGKWERDTLVVDTVGFNDKSWLIPAPHTEMLHITERLRRPDLGHLEVEITYDDPGTFRSPAKIKVTNVLVPGEEVHEYVCAENNLDRDHLITK